MSQKVKIKVCGLTREADVAEANRLKADFFGINRYKGSPRFVDEGRSSELLGAIPRGRSVAIDVAPSNDVLGGYRNAGFQFLQVHFDLDTPIGTLAGWSAVAGRDRLWLVPRLSPDEPFPESILEFAETVVVDSYSAAVYGGSGATGDWQAFKELQDIFPDTRWMLAGGLAPDNIVSAVRSSGARMVDVNSGVEERPGIKSHRLLKAFFSELRS